MLKDTLNSVLDNIKERTTNPFLGTLLVVWTIRNWNLVYAIFTFNGNSNLHSRLSYIQQHFRHQSFFCNMLISILITMAVLVSTYLFLALSRLLTDSYDKIVLPWIAKITDKSSVVLKTEYLALQDVVKQLEGRLEEERLIKVTAQNERDNSDKRLIEALTMSEKSRTIENPDDKDMDKALHQRLLRIVKRIDDWGIEQYQQFIDLILDGNSFGTENSFVEMISVLKREGFIYMSENRDPYRTYSLTKDGEALLAYTNELAEARGKN